LDTIDIVDREVVVRSFLSKNIKKWYHWKCICRFYFTEKRNIPAFGRYFAKKLDTTDYVRSNYNAGEPILPEYMNRRKFLQLPLKDYLVKGICISTKTGELKYVVVFSRAPDVKLLLDDGVYGFGPRPKVPLLR